MLDIEENCATLNVLNTLPKDMAQLPQVTARQKNATEIRAFLLEQEKEHIKRLAIEQNIAISHLVRALLLEWAKNQDNKG
ncbi:hypothetical protein NIES4101_74030 [Calothrix sp. NIES-4101]|nr:hypothetical protein NIES4101_74030 [Calothrix sp. NIES-4101]